MENNIGNRDNRLLWPDYIKGICILLVLVGHHGDQFPILEKYIYLFHMPAFFFVAGFFSHPKNIQFKTYIKNKFKAYLVPYLAYNMIWFIFRFIIVGFIKKETINWNYLIGVVLQMPETIYSNSIWFLTALFVSSVLFYLIVKIVGKKQQIVLIIICLLSAVGLFAIKTTFPQRAPWYIDSSIFLLPYMSIGYFCGHNDKAKKLVNNIKANRIKLTFTIIILIIVSIISVHVNVYFSGEKIDYHRCDIWEPISCYIGGICSVLLLTIVVQFIKRSRLLLFIGYNSLIYYLFDWIGCDLIVSLAKKIGVENPITLMLLELMGAAIITIPIVYIIRKYFYSLFGLKKLNT